MFSSDFHQLLDSHLNFYSIYVLNKDQQSKAGIIFGSRGWWLYTGLTIDSETRFRELGYNEYTAKTNLFLPQIGRFSTQNNPIITNENKWLVSSCLLWPSLKMSTCKIVFWCEKVKKLFLRLRNFSFCLKVSGFYFKCFRFIHVSSGNENLRNS